MIKISNLKVKKGKKEILNIDGLDTENTKYLGIFGGNGAGKTTLAKCIIGMESFEGEIVKSFQIAIHKWFFKIMVILFMLK